MPSSGLTWQICQKRKILPPVRHNILGGRCQCQWWRQQRCQCQWWRQFWCDNVVNDYVNFCLTMLSMMVSIFIWQCCQWWCQFWCDNAAVQVTEFHKLNFVKFYYISYIIYYIVFYYCQGRLPKCVQISRWWSTFFLLFFLLYFYY